MSTRANIGLKKKDGTIEVVYSHSDGYPEYMGDNLLNNYTNKYCPENTNQIVKKLLALGDISFLDERLQDSRFYNSWRDEDTHSRTYESLEEYENHIKDGWIEYIYLWDEDQNKWIYSPVPYEELGKFDWRPLDTWKEYRTIMEDDE